jgi:hypothetical protein
VLPANAKRADLQPFFFLPPLAGEDRFPAATVEPLNTGKTQVIRGLVDIT